MIASGNAAPIRSVYIMTFNVENLFDNLDDADNPHDDEYLGWSDAEYDEKLASIAEVILAMDRTPDVLVMPETENKKVVEDLVNKHLAGQGYQSIVALDTSDEPDSRGIDVAIISKLPLVGEPTAHLIDFGEDATTCGRTRDIVEAAFQLPGGSSLTVLGVHFPSQNNPAVCREAAMTAAASIRAAKGDNAMVVMAGDLNFNCGDLASPDYMQMLTSGGWFVSPVVRAGCRPPGSSFFIDEGRPTWSFLDHILISPSLLVNSQAGQSWFADLGSFQTVLTSDEQIRTNDKGQVSPRSFAKTTGVGVSDHWPVMIRLLER